MNEVSKLARGFASVAAALFTGFALNAQAEPVLGEKTPISGGWTRTITDENGNGTSIVNVYTNTNTKGYEFIVPDRITKIDYLIVGGGGSGGGNTSYYRGGGGGAGGLLTNTTAIVVEPGSALTNFVGKGGAASSGKTGSKGGDSSLTGLEFVVTAYGGGGGGSTQGTPTDGGCGGGAGGGGNTGTAKAGGKGTSGQGCDGGTTPKPQNNQDRSASGGGGAGGAGGDGGTKLSYATGIGGEGVLCDITGEARYYAGGGGGGCSATSAGAAGGSGVGGAGGYGSSSTTRKGQPGVDGTGSGGGGTGNGGSAAGKGGSGVVAIRYTPQVLSDFKWDATKCNVAAYRGETEVTDATSVNSNAVIIVTAVPNPTFGYTSIPTGWEEGENGTITKTFTAGEDFVLAVPDPEKTGGGELVSVAFVEAQNATYVATMGGQPLLVTMVEKGSSIDVVASPNEHYEYATVPQDWTSGEGGAITRTYLASEDITITIPDPDPILVTVSVSVPVELGANVAYTITTNDVEIASGDKVLEGTEVIVTVTPQGIYEYSAAPENWTRNNDGTITYTTSAEVGMMPIAVPTDNFRKQQVKVKFTATGVSYVATNLTTNLRIKNGEYADVDAQIAIIATRYAPIYVFGAEMPTGWTKVDDNVVTGQTLAASSIEIPTATWTPTDGELIENGSFEYFDSSEFAVLSGFPASLAGTWDGYQSDAFSNYKCYGLWKEGSQVSGWPKVSGGPRTGTYAACSAGNQVNDPYIEVSFTTPPETRTKTQFKLIYYVMRQRSGDASSSSGAFTLAIREGEKVVQSLTTQAATTWDWDGRTHLISGLSAGKTYKLRFSHAKLSRTYFAIDDVSLKMLPPSGTVIVIH